MLTSIALIFLGGLLMTTLCKKIHIPAIIGMLCIGVLLGPSGLSLLDDKMLAISPDLRQAALVIILLKAGLSLDINVLKKVGRPAFLLCFLPATLEIVGFILLAPILLGVSRLDAALMGAVMGAVSPAVIVPRMTRLIDEGWGTDKGIPQMIIAGASADDIYVIVIFSALTTLSSGGDFHASSLLSVPVSMLSGLLLGFLSGLLLVFFFKHHHMRDTVKVLILLAVSFLMLALEDAVSGYLPLSALLAIMAMGITIYNRYDLLAKRIISKFTKLWIPAEIILFVLVGAMVDVRYALHAGAMMVLMVILGLCFRLFGTFLCLLGTELDRKERVFCLLSEIPKATVQAAIGGVPLALGLPSGEMVLTLSVVSIIVTAPLGALLIDATYQKFLQKSTGRTYARKK